MVQTNGGTGRGRGRPRDPSYDDAIRRATTELLAERGYQGVTMSEVARRASVAKTTIYRRWDTKAQLVVDAISEDLEIAPDINTEEAQRPREALCELVVWFYGRLGSRGDDELPVEPARLLVEPDIVAEFSSRFLAPVRRRGAGLIERARRRGEFDADGDALELMDLLIAPALYQAMVLRELPRAQMGQRVFDTILG